MHYTGTTFRPPYEAWSLLLQVTVGCSHNACTFCSMYRDVEFEASPLEEIEEDLAELAEKPRNRAGAADRMFLVNGDAFCLPAERLLQIADLIHTYLPSVKTIGGYASINNIASKTDEELVQLKDASFADFNIGLESGMDSVLSYMNKGYTAADARTQLARLQAAGMSFNLNIINAAAGPDLIEEHAAANANIVNFAKPTLVFVSPLHADPGTPLEADIAAGRFVECNLGQYIDEEMRLLEGLELEHCMFFGTHVSNPIPVQGMLPERKTILLQQLREGKEAIPAFMLKSTPNKGPEGRLAL